MVQCGARALPHHQEKHRGILQASPGVVTTCLLLFKCPISLAMPDLFKCRHLILPLSRLPTTPALLRIEGPIATITLNRPAAFNAINLSIARKLERLGAEIEASDDIRVLVIEGQGRAFCAGGDLQTIG
jgi:Enoyl-CoA hydratase/isomerase